MSSNPFTALFGTTTPKGTVEIIVHRPDGTHYTAKFRGDMAVANAVTYLARMFPADLARVRTAVRELARFFFLTRPTPAANPPANPDNNDADTREFDLRHLVYGGYDMRSFTQPVPADPAAPAAPEQPKDAP